MALTGVKTAAKMAQQHKLSGLENDRMRQAAEILQRARREVKPIHELPEKLRPHSLDEAYALQDIMAMGMSPEMSEVDKAISPIGGWKIGASAPDATPVFAPMVLWGGFARSGDRISATFRRLRGVEAEIAFLLRKDLPAREKPYGRDEVIEAIESAHPAIELLESAFRDPDKVDRLSVIGDLMANGGFAYGPAVSDWQDIDLTSESVTVTVDGTERYSGKAGNLAGTDLIRLVTWLANECSYRTGGLKSGQWITTGTWSGQIFANAGNRVDTRFSRFGAVTLTFD